jgi:predicted TIM-barrel fold metal-dependent hydrolase
MSTDSFDGEILDAHIHPRMVAKPNHWYWDPGSAQQQVDDLRRAGIDRACGSVIDLEPLDGFEGIRDMNDRGLAFRDQFPDFFLPGIQMHPDFPQESCAELERCITQHGARWIGELVGYIMGYGDDYVAPGFEPIYALAAQLRVPVNIHCGNLKVIEQLCTRFPQVNVVLAHPNDGQECRDRIALVARSPNLYLDLSGTGVMRLGMIRYAIDQAGVEKILLGTDFPICNPAMYVQCALYEPLSHEERVAVLAGNYRRLVDSE